MKMLRGIWGDGWVLKGKLDQERIIFDNRTQMNADNQDFKYNVYNPRLGFLMPLRSLRTLR